MDELIAELLGEEISKCFLANKTTESAETEIDPLCQFVFDFLQSDANETDVTSSDDYYYDNVTIAPTEIPETIIPGGYKAIGQLGCALMAILIIIIVMIQQKRSGTCCPRCCFGYFGLIIPVNFLESRQNRLTILAAFSVTSVGVLEILAESSEVTKGMSSYLKMLIRLGFVMGMTLMCSPFLLCFASGTYLSLILGMLYTIMYVLLGVYFGLPETPFDELLPFEIVKLYTGDVIVIFSAVIVLCGYSKKIYKKITSKGNKVKTIQGYQKTYVTRLLAGKSGICCGSENGETSPLNNLKLVKEKEEVDFKEENKCTRCLKAIYRPTPGFGFALSILISITVGFVIVTYVMAESLAGILYLRHMILDVLLQSVKLKQFLGAITLPNLLQMIVRKFFKGASLKADWVITLYDVIYDQTEVILVCFCTTVILDYVVMCFIMVSMLKSYKTNILSLQQRKRDDNLLRMKDTNKVRLVVSAVQYCGYQVAYIMWGTTLQIIVFGLILIILCEVIFLPIKYGSWSVILTLVDWITPIVITMLITKGVQMLLVKFVFLQERGQVLALNNRRGFYIMMYFMFYYNIFMGMFSCLMRVIKATIFGLWFLPRLDRSIFPRTFEHMDGGFKAYTCLMKLEAMQSNVIVTCFVNKLLEKKPMTDTFAINVKSINENEKESQKYDAKKKRFVARNRWHVAYTLMHNPDLIKKRGPHQFFEDDDNKINEWESTV